jgi:hypothetical protein
MKKRIPIFNLPHGGRAVNDNRILVVDEDRTKPDGIAAGLDKVGSGDGDPGVGPLGTADGGEPGGRGNHSIEDNPTANN